MDQLADSIALIDRDGEALANFGWPQKNTDEIKNIREGLSAAIRNYEAKYGTHVGRTQRVAIDIDLAKRWRLRALAIAENNLTDPEKLSELRLHNKPVGRNAGDVGKQIAGILNVARAAEPEIREGGAEDAFFAEGDRLVKALEEAATASRKRPKDLPAEHDKLDALDGQAWELLKKLNRSGRALHISTGDRAFAAEYNLDVLYHRPSRRRTTKPGTPS